MVIAYPQIKKTNKIVPPKIRQIFILLTEEAAYQRCPTQCPRAFFYPPRVFRMPAGPFQKVIFDRKCPFYVVIQGDSTNIFFSSTKLARKDFLRQIVARSIKRLGTAALNVITLGQR